MLGFLFAAILGSLIGFLAGIVPGFHANNLALLVLSVSAKAGLEPLMLSIFVLSAGVAHSFSGFIPSIFLGAPSEETALAISPGHRMLLSGRGFQALCLCVAGGVFGMISVLFGFYLIGSFAAPIYNALRQYLGIVLVLVSLLMILIEKRKTWALLMFLVSGLFGIAALNSGINENFVLLPVLSGLFGASTLVLSYSNAPRIPRQSMKTNIGAGEAAHGALAGFFGGILAGFLPGVGASQSAIIAQRLTNMQGTRKFMIALGAIGSSDVILSLLALLLIGRTRSGIAASIGALLGTIHPNDTILFLGAGLFAAGIAAIASIKTGRFFAKNSIVRDTRKISLAVFAFLLGMCLLFTGFLGVLVFFTGTAIGILPHVVGTKKSILISCLLLPTALYFTGIDRVLLGFLGL